MLFTIGYFIFLLFTQNIIKFVFSRNLFNVEKTHFNLTILPIVYDEISSSSRGNLFDLNFLLKLSPKVLTNVQTIRPSFFGRVLRELVSTSWIFLVGSGRGEGSLSLYPLPIVSKLTLKKRMITNTNNFNYVCITMMNKIR